MKITIKNMVQASPTSPAVTVNLDKKTASVAGIPTDDAIRAKVDALGYLYLGAHQLTRPPQPG